MTIFSPTKRSRGYKMQTSNLSHKIKSPQFFASASSCTESTLYFSISPLIIQVHIRSTRNLHYNSLGLLWSLFFQILPNSSSILEACEPMGYPSMSVANFYSLNRFWLLPKLTKPKREMSNIPETKISKREKIYIGPWICSLQSMGIWDLFWNLLYSRNALIAKRSPQRGNLLHHIMVERKRTRIYLDGISPVISSFKYIIIA